MLRFFRVNDPYRLLGVLFIMSMVSLPVLIKSDVITFQELKNVVLGEALNDGKSIYTQVVDDTPWLGAQMAKWTEWMWGRSITARHVFALLLLFFQAGFFSSVLIRNKAYNENNYFPALIFGVLCFFSFDLLSLSDELWASTFLLFALNNLFKEIEFKAQHDENILNLGVFLSIASLFVFSTSIFLIGAIIILLIFARVDLRKSLMLLFGFLFPHLLLLILYYFKNGLPELGRLFYKANFTLESVKFVSWQSLLWLGSSVIVYFFFSMVMLGREARFTRYQAQLMQVMLIWLVIAAVNVLVVRELTPHSFVFFLPSLTYFLSHYLLLIRRKWIAEVMLWIFIVSVVGVSTTARLNKLDRVDYSRMFVTNKTAISNKRILVLGDNFELYNTNKMSSYFLNWERSKEIFELHHYYYDLVLISESFQKDPPEIIVDEQNKMQKIFSRLPSLETKYKRKGIFYERIN
ncbi:MAG TPA: hypothetical protein VL728_06855 [Cyclobacteriaceae bacterium]|nr:hypothetical protein [Cyclobacteriaceae bacterium]